MMSLRVDNNHNVDSSALVGVNEQLFRLRRSVDAIARGLNLLP